MMLNKNDQERVTQLLTDAITVLCKNGLSYESHVSVEGLLGITLDDREVFLVKIDENVTGHRPASGVQATEYKPSAAQRMAVTSPRQRGARPRGRTLPSRGRFVGFGNRKRNLFGGVPRSTGTLNSQGGLSPEAGEPPTKMRVQGDMTHSTTPAQGDSLIEIGDDDSNPTSGSVTASNIKAEPPDYPHTMPADSTQGPDSKYTLDNETSKSLTSFLDNLMTAHSARNEAGGNGEGSTSQSASSSSPSAAGSSALSHLAQMASPKSEPPAWDQQQYDSSSIPGSSPQPQQRVPYGTASPMISPQLFEPASIGVVPSVRPPPQTTQRLTHFPRQQLPTTASRPRQPKPHTTQRRTTAMDNASMMMYNNQMTSGQNAAAFSANIGPGEKYSCAKCGKTFKEKYHFFGHMNSHLNVRPYTCKKCGKGFSYSNSLSRHKRTCGAAEVGHKCDICQQSFGSVNALQMHLLQSHGSTY